MYNCAKFNVGAHPLSQVYPEYNLVIYAHLGLYTIITGGASSVENFNRCLYAPAINRNHIDIGGTILYHIDIGGTILYYVEGFIN